MRKGSKNLEHKDKLPANFNFRKNLILDQRGTLLGRNIALSETSFHLAEDGRALGVKICVTLHRLSLGTDPIRIFQEK